MGGKHGGQAGMPQPEKRPVAQDIKKDEGRAQNTDETHGPNAANATSTRVMTLKKTQTSINSP